MRQYSDPSVIMKTVFSLLVVLTLLAGCMQGDTLTGGSGSTTTNGFTASIRTSDGTAVSYAEVQIRPDDYLVPVSGTPVPVVSGTVADTFTDTNGTVTFLNMAPGNYSIEVHDPSTGHGSRISGTIDSSGIADFGEQAVVSTGAIKGVVDTAQMSSAAPYSVLVYGMERSVSVDTSTGVFIIPNLPPADYVVRLVSPDTQVVPIDYAEVTVRSLDTIHVDPLAQWAHHERAVITMSNLLTTTGDTLYNFPLLLRLDNSAFDFSTAKKNGVDLRVTTTEGSPVAFEIEWWDSTNATAAIWILMDTLYNQNTEQGVELYWGNKKASTNSQSSAVFDTTFGYRGVWHLNESGGTVQYDATVMSAHSTPHGMDGANDASGLAGRAQVFEEDSQYILIDSVYGEYEDTGITLSVWVLRNSNADYPKGVVLLNNHKFGLILDSDDRWVLYDSGRALVSAPATVDEWTLLTAVRNKTRSYLYLNGEIVDSADTPAMVPDSTDNGATLFIGSLDDSSGWFGGSIDEVRLYDHAVLASWIRMNYEIERKDQVVVSLTRK